MAPARATLARWGSGGSHGRPALRASGRGLSRSLATLAAVLGAASAVSLCGAPAQPFANSLGMRLQPIQAGSFAMGATSAGAEADEAPVHSVEISQPFFMAATEVTNAQFEQFAPDH